MLRAERVWWVCERSRTRSDTISSVLTELDALNESRSLTSVYLYHRQCQFRSAQNEIHCFWNWIKMRATERVNTVRSETYIWWDVCSMHCMPYNVHVARRISFSVMRIQIDDNAMGQSSCLPVYADALTISTNRMSLHFVAWITQQTHTK